MRRFAITFLLFAPLVGCGTTPSARDGAAVDAETDTLADVGADTAEVPDAGGGGTAADAVGPDADPPDVGPPDAAPDAAPDARPDAQPDAGPATGLLECEPSVRWSVPGDNWWLDPSFVGIAPRGGALLMLSFVSEPSQMFASADGRSLGGVHPGRAIGFDDDYTRYLRWDDEVSEVVDMRTSEVLLSIERPEVWGRTGRIALTPDGRYVAMLTCTGSEDGIDLELYEVGGAGTPTLAVSFSSGAEGFCPAWASHGALPMAVSRTHVAVAPLDEGVVHVVEVATGAMRTFEVSDAPAGEPWTDGRVVHSIALSPDGAELATADRGGVLRRWRIDDGTPIGDAIETSSTMLNEFTFTTPFRVSPIAYAPDGSAFAHLDGAGDIAIRRRSDGSLHATMPRSAGTAPGGSPEAIGVAALAFSADGRELGTIEIGGSQLVACGSPPLFDPPPIVLEASGPSEAVQFEAWPFELEVGVVDRPIGLRIATDDGDEFGVYNSASPSWSFSEPGAHTVRVIADDGWAQSEVRIEVDVRPR